MGKKTPWTRKVAIRFVKRSTMYGKIMTTQRLNSILKGEKRTGNCSGREG
jgi:hypothetical protein